MDALQLSHPAPGFASNHPGGVNFLLGDGSVRFHDDSIHPETFISLFTRCGRDLPK